MAALRMFRDLSTESAASQLRAVPNRGRLVADSRQLCAEFAISALCRQRVSPTTSRIVAESWQLCARFAIRARIYRKAVMSQP